MEFLMNDLSMHGQFRTTTDFLESVETLMKIRQFISLHGRELRCSQSLTLAKVTADTTMQQMIQLMPVEKRTPWIQWLTRTGPFWLNEREHTEDDWLDSHNELVVTDTAIGEAGFCRLHGLDRDLVSFKPSDWTDEKINVRWLKNDAESLSVDVPNHCSLPTVTKAIEKLPNPFYSWATLEAHARRTCDKLTIAANAFAFGGHPYVPGAAERILIRLKVLNRMCECFDSDGNRTAEGDFLYAKHFASKKAWFTDSGPDEKVDFKNELTFPHPHRTGQYLFCTWHGKVKTPQIRIHFSWPIAAKLPLYIVYVGPKITKR